MSTSQTIQTASTQTAPSNTSTPTCWIVRAGRKGMFIDEFLDKNFVAVGWDDVGDLTQATTRDAIKAKVTAAYPDHSWQRLVSPIGCLNKIRNRISVGDPVVTYDPSTRTYHVGSVTGEYEHVSGMDLDLSDRRAVKWTHQLHRDLLTDKAKYSLGCLTTIFEMPAPTWAEFQAIMSGKNPQHANTKPAQEWASGQDDEDDEQLPSDPVAEALERAHENHKDAINRLDPNSMEEFVACVLRGMGYKSRVTAVGPDRGCDIEASPDGLGLEEPRIRVEVKHRKAVIGAPDLRSFLGALRPGDKGLYVSTGGFTREAKYEAERSQVPLTLVDLDRLAELYIEFYETLAPEDRTLVPLTRVYWPQQGA